MRIINFFFIAISILLSSGVFAEDNSQEAGKKLFKTHCAACHGANVGGMDMSKRIAPPIVAVRLHYIRTYPDQASFVKAISDWIKKQDASKSLMPGAISRFKIMPPIVISKEDSNKIAAYIYAGDIKKPEGFREHIANEHAKQGLRKMQGIGKGMHQPIQGKGMRNINRVMQQLNLSLQQQKQIKTLIQQKKQVLRPLRAKMYQLKQAIRQLDSSNPNYKQQITVLMDKKSKLIHQIQINKEEIRMKIKAILTPEQYNKFVQIRKDYKEMN